MKNVILKMVLDLEESMDKLKSINSEYYKMNQYIKWSYQLEILYQLLRNIKR